MRCKSFFKNSKILVIFYIIIYCSCGIEKHYYVSKKNYLIENIQINDSLKLNMIFDTGSSQLLFDSIIFEKYNLKNSYKNLLVSSYKENDFNGTIILDTVKYFFAKKYNYSYPSGIVDLKKILGDKAEGLIGMNTIKSDFIKIQPSLQNGKVSLFEKLEIPKGYVKVPAIFSQDKIFTNVELELKKNYSVKLRLLIDTGYPGDIMIFYNDSIINIKQIENKLFYETLNDNINGGSYGYRFYSKKVKFFDFEERHVITDISINQSYSNLDFDGLIGMGVFNKYNFIIEKKKSNFFLKRNNENPKLKHPTLGISLVESVNNRYFVVNSIVKNSDAYFKGLRLRDTILEINNTPSYNIDDVFFEKLNNSKRKYYKVGLLKNGLFQEINIKKHEFIF